MKVTININGKDTEIELTKEQLAQAEAQSKFPAKGDEYYMVDDFGSVEKYRWSGDDLDSNALSIGNVFETKEEAEAHRDWLKAYAILRNEPGVSHQGTYLVTEYSGELDVMSFAYKHSPISFETLDSALTSLKAHPEEWKIFLGVK